MPDKVKIIMDFLQEVMNDLDIKKIEPEEILKIWKIGLSHYLIFKAH